ncbi:hypothetical protein [Paenibacillus tyrfis]|uniref:hypothetical protein n=1 Tax=Paenibacillus tyrfis TaxID=1501230 RepID=UPI0035CCE1BC
MGENFVGFRATDGRVGSCNESCPHRGCSLLLARNDENSHHDQCYHRPCSSTQRGGKRDSNQANGCSRSGIITKIIP